MSVNIDQPRCAQAQCHGSIHDGRCTVCGSPLLAPSLAEAGSGAVRAAGAGGAGGANPPPTNPTATVSPMRTQTFTSNDGSLSVIKQVPETQAGQRESASSPARVPGNPQGPEESTHQVRPVEESTHQVRPVEESTHQVRPVEESTHQVRPVEESTHQVRPATEGAHPVSRGQNLFLPGGAASEPERAAGPTPAAVASAEAKNSVAGTANSADTSPPQPMADPSARTSSSGRSSGRLLRVTDSRATTPARPDSPPPLPAAPSPAATEPPAPAAPAFPPPGTLPPPPPAALPGYPSPHYPASPSATPPALTGAAVSPDPEQFRDAITSARIESLPIGSARTRAVARHAGRGRARLRGAQLGAGVTRVPPVAPRDPEQAIMAQPRVPEERRFCPSCGAPVGRTRAGRPGRDEGYCSQCRTPYSFTPKLNPGLIVGGQYQVVGCLAHGGLGWVYLARDIVLGGRWVVLKGLLNAGDPDAYASAIAEREFLAQVEHPLILEIYNFVQHDNAGYIVMEYVGGTSLKDMLKQRMMAAGGRYDPIPVDQALAYLIEILPAFAYLHDRGLLYCDFKPDNLIQVGDAVKLIDLGGVRRIDDMESPIYGTVGYQAPEVATVGPSVASDIYTIGRSLAVLVTEFRGYQSTYATSLPPLADVPVFQRYDSLYRLLTKACAPDPADRFASADEMRLQMLGVLREVAAIDQHGALNVASTRSVPSMLFEAPEVATDTLDWQQLPTLMVDPNDAMSGWLSTVTITDPQERLVTLGAQQNATIEVLLALADAAIRAERRDVAEAVIYQVLGEDPWEWRAMWLTGLNALSIGDVTAARAAFNAVYGQVPGELAPKLALALACEHSEIYDVAESLYAICATTDANYNAAGAFGMLRVRAQRGDLDGALAALDLIPPTNRAFVEARRLRADLLASSGRGVEDLVASLQTVESVGLDPTVRAQLEVDVWQRALSTVLHSGPRPKVTVGGVPMDEESLRDAVEGAYRRLAVWEGNRAQRIAYVDAANAVRRWTWR